MSDVRIPFFSQAALLDPFIHSDQPQSDPDAVAVVIRAIKGHEALRRYFFRNRPHPAWLPLLRDNEFFSAPPAPVETDKGLTLPFWDVQDYLASVATEAPDFVVEHVLTLDGPSVYASQAIRCLLLLPVPYVKKAVPKIQHWLEGDAAPQIVEDAWDVTLLLARAGDTLALDLFAALMRPFPNPGFKRLEAFSVNDEAVSLVRDSRYERDDLQEAVRRLGEIDFGKTASTLESCLLLSLRIEAETAETDGQPSTWWRSAVEPSAQNFHHYYKDQLLDLLRDTCEAYLARKPAAAGETVEHYLQSPDGILRRLGLHLLCVAAGSSRDLLARELLQPANLNAAEGHHEAMCLLEDGFPLLDGVDRARIVERILAGPPPEDAERLAEWAEKNHGEERSIYIEGYRRHWVLTRLWLIRNHLTGEDAETLRRLVSENGEPEHPTHLSWSSGPFSVSDVSPLSAEQIAAYPPARLLAYLQEWQPEPERRIGPERVSREGLGEAVGNAVLSDLNAFAGTLGGICALHPDYAYPILKRGTELAKQGALTPEQWDVLLDMCQTLIGNPEIATSMERASRFTWRDVRLQITSLLDAILDAAAMEHAERYSRIRDMLIALCDDPDPDLESDRPKEGWVGHGDPLMVALNSVRPSALMGLIAYTQKMASRGSNGGGASKVEASVLDLLTRKLRDESLAVRSVYGRHLMLLYWLDKSWLEEHLQDIFPAVGDEGAVWMYAAAWDAYVIFNQSLYPELFADLRPYYERAIENLGRGYTTKTHLQPMRGLGSHLIYDYLERAKAGPVPQNGTLLHTLLTVAGGHDRGQIAWMVWRLLKDVQERDSQAEGAEKTETNQLRIVTGHYWPAARSLWQHRMAAAAGQNYPSDFDEEVGWFARLLEFAPPGETMEALWPLLQMTLLYVSSKGYRHQTWEALEEYLLREVRRDPARVIELYAQMHERSSGIAWKDETPRAILTAAAAAPASRRQALALIDFIARKGDMRFKDIYEAYAL